MFRPLLPRLRNHRSCPRGQSCLPSRARLQGEERRIHTFKTSFLRDLIAAFLPYSGTASPVESLPFLPVTLGSNLQQLQATLTHIMTAFFIGFNEVALLFVSLSLSLSPSLFLYGEKLETESRKFEGH